MMKLFFFAYSMVLYSNFAFTQSAKLDTQEMEALKEIREKLGLAGKKEWDLDKDPCNGEQNWNIYIFCNCSFESNTTCHIIKISMTSQNVSTALPSEFTKLPYLTYLDLSRNYINGTIPSEWETMHLNTLILMGNRLSGPFPIPLTTMTTLRYLSIDGNRFSGPIPEEIANLKNLERLFLSSNDFSGQLSLALAKLTNLIDLRISDNNFTGKIPNFISQWKQITTLHIEGCGFEGPIPSSISVLTELNSLIISDLKREASAFPSLEKMITLSRLVLRNCLIHASIPNYIGNLRNLIVLDLSFNNLTGEIPSSFPQLYRTKYIFLTENNLTGHMPGWVSSTTKNVDVSYNHFTWDDATGPKKCEQSTVNVLESYSSSTNKE